MDDLCIKMIANTKKLKDEGNKMKQDQKPLSSQQVDRLIQIFETHFYSNFFIARNVEKFTIFLKSNSQDIIDAFIRTIPVEKVE